MTHTAAELTNAVWKELVRATHDKHHEWRVPTLASVGLDGWPQARTVVLRHADPTTHQLHIYTDRRSPKVGELLLRPEATLVFWSRRKSWQLRVQVRVAVEQSGKAVEVAWLRVSQTAAASDYLAEQPPGAPLGQSGTVLPSHQLAVLVAEVQTMDWLELSRSGHRRARIDPSGLTWLTP